MENYIGFDFGWQSALLVDCVVRDIKRTHNASYSDAALVQQAVNPAQEVARVLSKRWPNNPVNKTVKPKVELAK